MKKRFNHYISQENFDWLQEKAHELRIKKASVAQLIEKIVEFARKNWKEFIKSL